MKNFLKKYKDIFICIVLFLVCIYLLNYISACYYLGCEMSTYLFYVNEGLLNVSQFNLGIYCMITSIMFFIGIYGIYYHFKSFLKKRKDSTMQNKKED